MNFYIILLPFSSVLALHQALPIYLVYIFIYSTKHFLVNKIRLKIDISDFVIFSFLFLTFFSFLFNQIYFQDLAGVGHLVAYSTSILFFYFFVKIFLVKHLSTNGLLNSLFWVYVATYFTVLFVMVEFLLKSILLFPFDSYIPRPAVAEMDAIALSYFRARGLAEEPGHTAMFFEIMIPISVFYLIAMKKFLQLTFFSIFSFIALVFTFSSATFVIIPASLFLTILIFSLKKPKSIINLIKPMLFSLLFAILVLLLFNSLGLFSFYDLVSQVLVKLSPDNSSASDRLGRLNDFFIILSNAELVNLLFGYGPGAYKSLEINSIVSLYPTIILEVGFLGMALFILFYLVIFIKILKIKNHIKWFLMCAFISSILHFFIISNYWYPWFWFLCALAVVLSTYEFELNLKTNKRQSINV